MNKNLNILLVCGAGASSSFMAAKMRMAAKEKRLTINIRARSEGEIGNYLGDIDALMVGPHLEGDYERLKKIYKDEIAVILMEKDYYAKLDGKKAVEHLLRELEEYSKEK
ncbi:MAG: PTS sugar transporter subunit IIB [Erysipelotrichaceae bacterium]|nr:PTS sugar transporter subunit IIB [Erysipelotrichaceae bacterium]